MKRSMKKGFVLALGAVALLTRIASATPSTHIWAPSTDVQAYGVFHLTHDVYIPVEGAKTAPITNEGFTVGVIPSEKINMEVGFDLINGATTDATPLYFNAKMGVPENSLGEGIPALAVGAYAVGTKSDSTDYNVLYAKVGKTVPVAGRFSIGYFLGNEDLLGKDENSGILLCWERTMSEISDNLWVAVDYQGSESALGALSYGFSWKFAPNTSVILGYDDYNNASLADTYTVQLDIDFDVFSGKK